MPARHRTDPPPVTVTGGLAVELTSLGVAAGRFADTGTDLLAASISLHAYLAAPAVLESAALDPLGLARFEAELLLGLDGPAGLIALGLASDALAHELGAAAAVYAAADHLPGPMAHPVNAALGGVAAAVPDGHGVVCHPGIDRAGVAGRPPRRLTDVVADLAQRNHDARHGEIDVRILTRRDGSRRVIVDITGTKSWDPLPTRDITSLSTNERAIIGRRTAYEGGVLAALRRAGVRPGDPVMLVGHSEGGLVAVTTARDALASGAFDVTQVITAGAPIGRTAGQLPARVQVLALENRRDVVPRLDGSANPARANVTTVAATEGDGTVGGDHGLDSAYLPVAADAQASPDPAIRAFLASADGYFRATSVVTHTFQIQRRY